MSKKKTSRLSDVVSQFAEQGANDAKWFMIEHQLIQAKVSLKCAIETLVEIGSLPENEGERNLVTNCLDVLRSANRWFLGNYAAYLSYLSDTDVSERISRKEL